MSMQSRFITISSIATPTLNINYALIRSPNSSLHIMMAQNNLIHLIFAICCRFVFLSPPLRVALNTRFVVECVFSECGAICEEDH